MIKPEKVLIILFTILLLITAALPVYAVEAMSDAEICEKLGILKGEGSGLTDEYLDSVPTRMQAAIMFLRLKGLENKAIEYQGQFNFKDAGKVWSGGRAMLAYLKANPELGWLGDGTGNFNPLAPVEAKEYTKVLLTALGYQQDVDFSWENVEEFATSIGIVKLLDIETFTVRVLATGTVEALKSRIKGEGTTLMGELVSSGAISAERAESVGIPVGNLEPLAVESVTVPNLMQLKVTFNAGVTLKSASEPNNYAVYAGRSRIDIVVANLQPDGRTVILTLDKAVSQNELLDLTVRNIRGINGDRISREEYNGIECIDILSPKVEKIEVLGEDTIAVTFNEPVEAGNKYLYEVNRGDIPVKRVIEQDNYTKFILILEHEPETSKISLRISGNVKDMAGFNLIPVTYDVDMEN